MHEQKTSAARAALASAISAKLAAEAELASAERALFGTRELVDRAQAEVNRLIAADGAVASARAKAIKFAMRSGDTPTIEAAPGDLAAITVARGEAENGLRAARQAHDELEDEVRAARASADKAAGAILAAANAVAAAEGDAIAAEIERLEESALGFRMLLGGGSLSPLGMLPKIGEPLRRVLASNDTTDIGTRNTAEWHSAMAFAGRWHNFIKALASDAGAVFDGSAK